MYRTIRNFGWFTIAAGWSLALATAPSAKAQLFSWTKEEMVEYTKAWTGERFADGRPKVPDSWLERAKGMSSEEANREGVSFIPPSLAESVLDKADETHVHDEWTKMKFDEGKYKSTDIYSVPKTDALRKEYQEFLKKKLDELKAARAAGKK